MDAMYSALSASGTSAVWKDLLEPKLGTVLAVQLA